MACKDYVINVKKKTTSQELAVLLTNSIFEFPCSYQLRTISNLYHNQADNNISCVVWHPNTLLEGGEDCDLMLLGPDLIVTRAFDADKPTDTYIIGLNLDFVPEDLKLGKLEKLVNKYHL